MTGSHDAAVAQSESISKGEEKKRKRRFVGFSEQLEEKRRKRAESNKPRPWIERKLTIGIVIGLVSYTWYVYVGRFCVPMIRKDGGALGGRTMGSES